MRIGNITNYNSFISIYKNNNVENGNKYCNFRPNKALVSFGSQISLDYIRKKMVIELTNMLYGHRPFGFHSPEGYAEALKKFDVKDLMTLQGESAVFLLNNPGFILKMSCAPYEKFNPVFHAPELGRGVIVTDKKYPIVNFINRAETDKFYWVIQKKGITPVSSADENSLVQKALASGYKSRDIRHDQFAYFDGEAKFIDLGCLYKGNDTNILYDKILNPSVQEQSV